MRQRIAKIIVTDILKYYLLSIYLNTFTITYRKKKSSRRLRPITQTLPPPRKYATGRQCVRLQSEMTSVHDDINDQMRI